MDEDRDICLALDKHMAAMAAMHKDRTDVLYDIAISRNRAKNGRAINEMLFVLMLVLAIVIDHGFFWFALCPVLSMVLAYLADLRRDKRFSLPSLIATVSTILSILVLWL